MSAIFFPNSHCTKPVQARRGADLLRATVAYSMWGEDASGSTSARARGQPQARSTVKIWGAALKAFSKSRGMELALPYMKVSNKIPYFFSEEEVSAIFNSTTNLKHYTMLNLMFYCILRAGDLINLEDGCISMKSMTLRIRDGSLMSLPYCPYRKAVCRF